MNQPLNDSRENFLPGHEQKSNMFLIFYLSINKQKQTVVHRFGYICKDQIGDRPRCVWWTFVPNRRNKERRLIINVK